GRPPAGRAHRRPRSRHASHVRRALGATVSPSLGARRIGESPQRGRSPREAFNLGPSRHRGVESETAMTSADPGRPRSPGSREVAMTIDSVDPGGAPLATGPDVAPAPTRRGIGGPISRRDVLSLGVGALGGLAIGRATAAVQLPSLWPLGAGSAYADHAAPRTALPPIPRDADLDVGRSAARAIAVRRSIRAFDPARSISAVELSRLLFLTAGITDGGARGLRAQPSAGALYPIETYAMVLRVDEIAPGIYRYD